MNILKIKVNTQFKFYDRLKEAKEDKKYFNKAKKSVHGLQFFEDYDGEIRVAYFTPSTIYDGGIVIHAPNGGWMTLELNEYNGEI